MFVGGVLGAIGLFAYKGLSDATLYFRNADEAVAQRDSLGTKRFRLQGTVVGEPVESGGTVDFQSCSTACRRRRAPGQPARPVPARHPGGARGPLAGGGDVFASDRILVKHDESYESKDDYEDRVSEADEGGEPGGGGPQR